MLMLVSIKIIYYLKLIVYKYCNNIFINYYVILKYYFT